MRLFFETFLRVFDEWGWNLATRMFLILFGATMIDGTSGHVLMISNAAIIKLVPQ
jgi:hypothetical protein